VTAAQIIASPDGVADRLGLASRGHMTQSTASLRIGTRGSPLALVQARTVRSRLAAALGADEGTIELIVIRTTGDAIQDRPLVEEGGKGLFTKEIEEALLDGRIDLAVHSAKDMPTVLPHGLILAACLEREDPRDVFISRKAPSLAQLPRGASLGTTSPRRQAIAKRARPDLNMMPLRGNVETRLRKLDDGEVDATLLALAGLKRLGLVGHATNIMSADEFLPAVGQGAIGIEVRKDNTRVCEILARIDHVETSTAIACERSFLAALDGSCTTPIAGHATISGDTVQFRGLIARPDGSAAHDITSTGTRSNAVTIGAGAGRELKHRAGPGFFD
jgi:hydroxymethylbilane synthase